MQRSRARVKLRAMTTARACLAWMIFLCACNGDSATGDGGSDAAADGNVGPQVCAGDFDCPSSGSKCWFVVDGGCSLQSLKGVCMSFTPPDNCAATVACGCDGTTISECAPAGYVDRQSNSIGACPNDAGVDAGDDGGADASTD